jgi:DNA processing protein
MFAHADDASASARERAAVVSLATANLAPWHEIADLVTEVGSARAILDGALPASLDRSEQHLAQQLAQVVTDDDLERARQEIDSTLERLPDATLITVLDAQYPSNLRSIYNRPPFLYVRGTLLEGDETSIAVVGTRRPSPDGLSQASDLARALTERGVTVVSGMAAGIDTAAHIAALDAGGRTIAVMGTGITRTYPAQNRELADRIVENGALVSQFTPDSPPRRENFPMRNVVTSGIAVGTAVIEASSTSGAKMQARLALEHGKRVFLVERLVMQEDWAQKYAERPGCMVVSDVSQILSLLDRRPERAEQLKLV